MTTLTALTTICPPPASPPSTPDWSQAETELGMRLPEDYKQLMATYGPGEFCNFLSLYYPHAPREAADLTGPMPARLRQQIEEVRHNARQPWPLPHPPEQLFATGVTGNGDYLFWVTQPSDKPDAWDVAVNQALRAPWYTFTGTLTQFLLAVISGTTRVPFFPEDLLDNGTTFTPARPTVEPPPPTDQQDSMNPSDIRAWARANGHPLPDRGRIPTEIIEAWKRGHTV
ncbi:Lsr2 family protein [Streptomyces sp. NBC_01208]|uniref:Lsr2 family DNA-binding protein n=1 Tax=Streptomyces sp. NBC_01208 TaxID=2903773 RepID=UPI002E0D71D7|nr:Lsr2 family protein [Streptomyces sp. NBC_01208]